MRVVYVGWRMRPGLSFELKTLHPSVYQAMVRKRRVHDAKRRRMTVDGMWDLLCILARH
jgi:hypothetical protein